MPGWFSTRGWVDALHSSYVNRPPQISGRAQDTIRNGAWDRVLHKGIENPACLWQISRDYDSMVDF